MKIYTGNGDGGFSTLSSSMKISKADERFEVLGCIDELVSFLGSCRAIVACPILTKKLEDLQSKLFSVGSAITFPQKREYLPTEIDIKYIEELPNSLGEAAVDSMDNIDERMGFVNANMIDDTFESYNPMELFND